MRSRQRSYRASSGIRAPRAIACSHRRHHTGAKQTRQRTRIGCAPEPRAGKCGQVPCVLILRGHLVRQQPRLELDQRALVGSTTERLPSPQRQSFGDQTYPLLDGRRGVRHGLLVRGIEPVDIDGARLEDQRVAACFEHDVDQPLGAQATPPPMQLASRPSRMVRPRCSSIWRA